MPFISNHFQVLGSRAQQLDRYYANDSGCTYIVADGVGTNPLSGVLAERIVNEIGLKVSSSTRFDLVAISSDLNAIVQDTYSQHIYSDIYNVGTTLVIIKIINEQLYCAHIGDSRAYVFEDNKLVYVTKDHNMAEALDSDARSSLGDQAVRQLARRLTKAISLDEQGIPAFDSYHYQLKNNNTRILLCTDGVYGVPHIEGDFLIKSLHTLKEKCLALSTDNASLILIEHKEDKNQQNFLFYILVFACIYTISNYLYYIINSL